jgi:hypothetical protein
MDISATILYHSIENLTLVNMKLVNMTLVNMKLVAAYLYFPTECTMRHFVSTNLINVLKTVFICTVIYKNKYNKFLWHCTPDLINVLVFTALTSYRELTPGVNCYIMTSHKFIVFHTIWNYNELQIKFSFCFHWIILAKLLSLDFRILHTIQILKQ